jgi:hypothetical protein
MFFLPVIKYAEGWERCLFLVAETQQSYFKRLSFYLYYRNCSLDVAIQKSDVITQIEIAILAANRTNNTPVLLPINEVYTTKKRVIRKC